MKNKSKVRMPAPVPLISTKAAAYRLFHAGAFGNSPRSWASLDALYASDYRGPVTIRYAEPHRPFSATHIPFNEVPARVAEWVRQGARLDFFRPNESLPDHRLLIQGEYLDVGVQPLGDYLRYSTAPGLNMRAAMAEALHARGYRVMALLRLFMDPDSLDAFFDLRRRYPNSVIEFCTYSVFVGQIPRRNTIFFELRDF
jgi:hypothetical protein